MIRSRILPLAVILGFFALAGPARAQTAPAGSGASEAADALDAPPAKADNRARAQQLFDDALADAEAGRFAAACPKFLASQEADPKTSTLLNLANCYEKNGQTASAWGAFREAVTLARSAGRGDWEEAARARAEALEPKLVRMTIDVPDASRAGGLTVTRDGLRVPTGEWGVAIPVDPGEHVVAASAEGRLPWETTVPIREQSGSVTVPPLALAPTPPPVQIEPPPQPAPRFERPSWWTPLRTAGVAAGGVGVAAIATGLVLGLVAKGHYDDARAQCADGTRACPPRAVSDANGAYGLATGATIAFVAGAAALAAGGALIVFSAPASPQPSASASASASPPPAPSTTFTIGLGAITAVHRW